VIVKDSHNNPVAAGYSVTFTAPAVMFPFPTGAFSGSNSKTVQTDSSGVADPGTFTANTAAGAFTVTVAVSGAPNLNFSMTNKAGAAATVANDSPTIPASQSVVAGSTFAQPLRVVVRDIYGNSVDGVSVVFTAPAAGASGTFTGSLTTITIPSSGGGFANAGTFKANATTGSYNVSVAVIGTPGFNFAMTNT
jgi:hypothetical protein